MTRCVCLRWLVCRYGLCAYHEVFIIITLYADALYKQTVIFDGFCDYCARRLLAYEIGVRTRAVRVSVRINLGGTARTCDV